MDTNQDTIWSDAGVPHGGRVRNYAKAGIFILS